MSPRSERREEARRVPAALRRTLGAAGCGPPRRRNGIVDRDGVVKGLVDADPELVVVCAPPGYGKTSTVQLWSEADARPFAWVPLDRADDDPLHLLRHVAGALGMLDPLDDEVVALVAGAGRSLTDEVLPAVVAALVERCPLVLVLDDAHLLGSAPVVACVESIVDVLPHGSAVALIGRSVAPFHVARRRVNQQLHEVGTEDLAMTPGEARQAFDRAGLALDESTVAQLVERTEGWPAALHLAALRLRDDRGGDAPPLLSGRDRLVADYLVDEVLAGLPAPTASFLERSSVLERMSAPLLDALLDTDDAATHLADIERTGNLFLVPLDTEGRWYRYHHLFAELLRSRLAAGDPVAARRLHQRASDLLARDGDADAAIHQALAAGDTERAARLVAREAAGLVLHGRTALVARWLDDLGPAVVDEHPAAALAWAWVGVGTADADILSRAMDAARAALPGLGGGAADADLLDGLAVMRAVSWAGPVDELVDDALDAVADGDPRRVWWALAGAVRGTARAFLGRHDEARADFERTVVGLADLPAFQAVCFGHLALLALEDGDEGEARRCAANARRVAHGFHLEALPAAVGAFAAVALVAARTGRRDEAVAEAGIAADLLERLGAAVPRTALLGRVVLARTALALDDRTAAAQHLRRADALPRHQLRAVHLDEQLDEVRAALAADHVRPGRPTLTPAEQRVLPLLPTHLSQQEIADRLYVSRNTVKTHSVSIYRKLGVSSRGEAVAVARQLGLLAP